MTILDQLATAYGFDEPPNGYGFECKGCGAEMLLIEGKRPRPPFETLANRIVCHDCQGEYDYIGRMMRIGGRMT